MPWYKEVSRQEWKTFLTTFAAWTLDAFDFTIITFVLTDIRRSFEVNLALAGALATVTLFFRMVGGIGAGTLADRYGRKGPILFSIAWYTGFAFLSGLSTSYVMLFTFRGLFGIGMGGMWAAGMPLALEQWPAKHRGIASGILQGGYSVGFLLSSLVYQLGYPLVSDNPDWAWRLMLWAGVLPAIVVFFLMTRVSESPLWLEQQRLRGGKPGRLSLARLFDPDLRWVTIHTSLLMGAFVWMYQSTTIWYPTLLGEPEAAAAGVSVAAECRRRDRLDRVRHALREMGRPPRRRHARHGRRHPLGAGLPVLEHQRRTDAWRVADRLLRVGRLGHRARAICRSDFRPRSRGVGTGFSYHVGVGIGAFAPYLIGVAAGRRHRSADRRCSGASSAAASAWSRCCGWGRKRRGDPCRCTACTAHIVHPERAPLGERLNHVPARDDVGRVEFEVAHQHRRTCRASASPPAHPRSWKCRRRAAPAA